MSHRVQFRRTRWQAQQRDVVGDGELGSGVPTGSVHDDDGVTARRDVAADLGEMLVHGLVVDARHHEGGPDAALGRHRAEHVG